MHVITRVRQYQKETGIQKRCYFAKYENITSQIYNNLTKPSLTLSSFAIWVLLLSLFKPQLMMVCTDKELSIVYNEYNNNLSKRLPIINNKSIITIQVKGCQLSTIYNQYKDNLNEKSLVIDNIYHLLHFSSHNCL